MPTRPHAIVSPVLAAPLLLAAPLAFAGCYRTHERGERDAAVHTDTWVRADAAVADAFELPLHCDELVVARVRALDDTTRAGVTPRLVALPGDELAVVYVSVDGDPTRVSLERFSADLERLAGPVTIAGDAWTWAEPTWTGEQLAIAYGRTAADPSEIALASLDGVVRVRTPVMREHPSFLRAVGGEYLWVAFESHDDNAFAIDRLDHDGASRGASRIELGRYGSGHGLAALEDGAYLLGYSREGPPGVRQVYLRRLAADASLGPELALSDRGDSFAVPATRAGEAIVVFGGRDALSVATIDPVGPRVISQEDLPIGAFGVVAAFAGDRALVATFGSDGLVLRDFGPSDDEGFVTLPGVMLDGAPQGGHAVSLRGAAIVTTHVVRGSETFPVLVRVACVGGA